MKYFRHLRIVSVLFGLFYLMFPKKSYAYLDPGTGSYFIQLMMAALLGGLFVAKLFLNRIKKIFKNLVSRKSKHEEAEG